MRHLFVLSFLLATTLQGQVRINEILFVPDTTSDDPNKNRQWVEIFNAGSSTVSLSSYAIGNRAGRSEARPIGSQEVAAGGYLVVPFDTPLFNEESDEVALYSAEAIVDFQAWASNSTRYQPGTAHNDAVAAGIWTRNAHLNRDRIAWTASQRFGFVKPGESLGRSPDSTDTNHPLDFYSGGGISALGATPGRRNYDPLLLAYAEPSGGAVPMAAGGKRRADPAPLPEAEWTVFLYFMGDDPTLTQALQKNINEIAAAGGSTAKVNFVVLFDWVQGGYQQLSGVPDPVYVPVANGTVFGRLEGLDQMGRVKIDIGAVDEVNSADGATLEQYFLKARELYPARKYSLIIGSHGDGWKGLGRDMMSRQTRDLDRLYIFELNRLRGVDLLVLDACLMASLEVAYEIGSIARYVVASEDAVPAEGLAYDRLVLAMNEFPEETGEQIGRRMLRHFRDKYSAGAQARVGGSLVLSVLDQGQLPHISETTDAWARWLEQVTPLFGEKIEDPTDNVHVFLRQHATEAQRFFDQNFVDLRDFAERVQRDTRIPTCGSDRGAAMLAQLERVILQQTMVGNGLPGAKGLHIHFPQFRVWPGRLTPDSAFLAGFNEPFDFPTTRRYQDDNSYASYTINRKQLPLAGRDQEGISPDFNTIDWPNPLHSIPSLSVHTSWDEFLNAYYHPVAAARIIPSQFSPRLVQQGACTNPVHQITVPVGTEVRLAGDGSSDADMPPGRPPVPLHYRWDLDPFKDCAGNCVQPTEINDGGPAPGSLDALISAMDNVDQDRHLADSTIDDRDDSAIETKKVCDTPRTFPIHLHVIDDSHLWPFHNNYPSGKYLRFQSSTHLAVVECVIALPPGTRYGTTQVAPFNQDGDRVGVGVGVFPPNSTAAEPNQPVQVTPGTRVRSGTANGVALTSNAPSTVYSNPRGEFRINFILGDPVVLPGAATPGRLAVDPPGIASLGFVTGSLAAALQFRYVPRLAPLPTQMIVTPPTGTLVVGRDYDIILEARLNGVPLQDAVFTLQNFPGGLEFSNGTLFNGNRSNQVRTPAGGRTFARFRPVAPGPLEIEVFSGQLHEVIRLNVEGTAQAPTYIDTTAVPKMAKVNEEVTAVVTLFSRLQPVPNSPLAVEVLNGGPIQTLTTNAQGRIEYKLRIAGTAPVGIKVSVPGGTLTTTAWIAVEPPVDPPTEPPPAP